MRFTRPGADQTPVGAWPCTDSNASAAASACLTAVPPACTRTRSRRQGSAGGSSCAFHGGDAYRNRLVALSTIAERPRPNARAKSREGREPWLSRRATFSLRVGQDRVQDRHLHLQAGGFAADLDGAAARGLA